MDIIRQNLRGTITRSRRRSYPCQNSPILSGLPKEYDTLKYSPKTRAGALTVDVVAEYLLEAEQDMKEQDEEKIQENRQINVINQSGNATTYQIGGQLSGSRATAIPIYTEHSQPCLPGCHCSIYVQASGTIAPSRAHDRSSNYRSHPYGRGGGRDNSMLITETACAVIYARTWDTLKIDVG